VLTLVIALVLLAIAGVALLVSTAVRGTPDDEFVKRSARLYRRDDDEGDR
jgi:hypothetical protein